MKLMKTQYLQVFVGQAEEALKMTLGGCQETAVPDHSI